ncbi:unnamed protein product, partial [Darwinula stevensoni]
MQWITLEQRYIESTKQQPSTDYTKQTTPLGSLWKLFVYAYLQDTQIQEPIYQCRRTDKIKGDEFCCNQEESLDRDTALVRSCGNYFAPKRLGITEQDWSRYWQRSAPQAKWMHSLSNMQPATSVMVEDILQVLQQMPQPTVKSARTALLGRLLQPEWQSALTQMGSAYRFKTYTWDDPKRPGAYVGGAAGWLADGRVFWIGGRGRSKDVIQRISPMLPAALAPSNTAAGQSCVQVDFLHRYPLRKVTLQGADKAITGTLRGAYVAHLAN